MGGIFISHAVEDAEVARLLATEVGQAVFPVTLGRIWRANGQLEKAREHFAPAVESGETTRDVAPATSDLDVQCDPIMFNC